ncbi:MAG: thiamine-phosphate synthase family protein [Candidatus Hodarchaeota archaeon]
MNYEEMANRFLVIENLLEAVKILESDSRFSGLIPEVRTNIAMAIPSATSKKDVAGVEGRITVVSDLPRACGPIRFGASSHMARFLLARMKFDKSKKAVINIRNDSEILKAVQKMSEEKNLLISNFNRKKEPENTRIVEGRSLVWAMDEAIKNAGGKIPDIIVDGGGFEREGLIRLFGRDAIEVVGFILRILEIIGEKNRE